MSFGFSIGDFLAVGKLVAEIITSLQDAGGAKSDYQDLIRELECLGQVLRRLDKLQTQNTNTNSLESIKYAALSCQRPLENFLSKIRQYEDTLGVRAQPNIFGKSSVHKIRWSLGKKEEVTKLQSYLSVHIGTINILLAEHGLETLHVASRDADGFHVHVRGTLEGMQRVIGSIEGNLGAQRHAVEANNSMLTTICQMVCGDISTGLNSLMGMASAVCVRTQQIYGILLELKSSFQASDTRWTWFQDPLKIEDALGLRFPIPAEYGFDLIEVIIKTRFKNGPGSQDVQLGNYEPVQARDSSQAICSQTRLRPGTHIIMAIIINKHDNVEGEEVCPMPRCGSTKTRLVFGGGRECLECGVWFGESNRKRKRAEDPVEQENCKRRCSLTESSSGGRYISDFQKPAFPVEETGAYKNVRCCKPNGMKTSAVEKIPTHSEDADTSAQDVGTGEGILSTGSTGFNEHGGLSSHEYDRPSYRDDREIDRYKRDPVSTGNVESYVRQRKTLMGEHKSFQPSRSPRPSWEKELARDDRIGDQKDDRGFNRDDDDRKFYRWVELVIVPKYKRLRRMRTDSNDFNDDYDPSFLYPHTITAKGDGSPTASGGTTSPPPSALVIRALTVFPSSSSISTWPLLAVIYKTTALNDERASRLKSMKTSEIGKESLVNGVSKKKHILENGKMHQGLCCDFGVV